MKLATAGIDTVKLVSYEFDRVDAGRMATTSRAIANPHTGELIAEGARWAHGPGSFGFNTAPPNTLKACADHRRRFGTHRPGCGCRGLVWYEASAPKVFRSSGQTGTRDTASNVELVPPEVLHDLAHAASDAAMATAGCEVPPTSWHVARLDVAADVVLPGPAGRSLIASMARVRFPRTTPALFGDAETADHGNSRRRLRIYDKGIEASLPDYFPGERVRFECQRRFDKASRIPAWSLDRRRAGLQLVEPLRAAAAVTPAITVDSPAGFAADVLSAPRRARELEAAAWGALLSGNREDAARAEDELAELRPRAELHEGRRSTERVLATIGAAAVLGYLGRGALLELGGKDRGYAMLRRLRELGFAPLLADELGADRPAPSRIELADVAELIASGFDLANG